MPSLADFFLGCVYVVVGSIVLALCIMIIGAAMVEVRKRWPR